jgi:hypothetical protein
MKIRSIFITAKYLLAAVIATAWPAVAQVPWIDATVVNIVPWEQSGEEKTDSEPYLAVNPANPQHMAASAFTPGPSGATHAPIYVSTDGGRTWKLNPIVPGNHVDTGTGDITLRFGSASNVFYAAVVRKDVSPRKFNILRTTDFASPSPMQLLVERGSVDQPHVEAITTVNSAGVSVDRVYVGYVDRHTPSDSVSGYMTAVTIERSLDAATAPPPSGFEQIRVGVRSSCLNVGGVRPAVHASGKIYAAFFRWTDCPPIPASTCSETSSYVPLTADLVVVRDNNWADGPVASAFKNLVEPSDGEAGRIVAAGVRIPYDLCLGTVGKQRLGTQFNIAVDPSNDLRVFLAWSDGNSPTNFTLHLRHSTDGGATWSPDLRTIVRAINPSLAINSSGTVGFLYQKLVNEDGVEKWETRLETSRDDFASAPADVLLHKAPDDTLGGIPAGPLGDYNYLMAVEGTFYGVFSGSNNPNNAEFSRGVTYQRNRDFVSAPKKLLNLDGSEAIASIDTFMFEARNTINLGKCSLPWQCGEGAIMKRGGLTLNCLVHRCIVIDVMAKNCIYKFNCPGCGREGRCPPFYQLHLSGLKDAWRVGLFDSDGKPVEYRQFKTRTGVVVSFRPTKDKFVDGRIGSYLLAFEMEPKGKIGTNYQVKTRLVRSDRHYEPPTRSVATRPR